MLFATHYLEEADLDAIRIVLISNGSIVADGTDSEIKATGVPGERYAPPRPVQTRGHSRVSGGVDHVEVRGEQVYVPRRSTPTSSPATCSPRPYARDLEITATGLEDAFLQPHRPSPRPSRRA